ncbi:MAG TPA: lysophospholipid acyltransferase family protein [Dongiaceae bacterium]
MDRAWRLTATGFAFALIFGGGSVAALTILPFVVGWKLTGSASHRNAQYAIHVFFRFYVNLLQWLGLIRLQVEGLEVLLRSRGQLIVANHPTLLDVVLLMALLPRAQCIVKHELWHNRYLGGIVRLAGYIPNNLDAPALLTACKTAIESGDNIIVFPEGTRTQPGKFPKFQRGFANIALLTAANIQLITITCAPLTLTKGEPWWRIPSHRPHFRVVVGDNLNAQDLLRRQERPLAARALVRQLETYYGEHLAAG